MGVVWARAVSGDNTASLADIVVADDKAQALFDNCFEITEGPDAPDVELQELDRELILYLTNSSTSNNFNESYRIADASLIIPDTINGVGLSEEGKDSLRFYEFQGYQIFQVKNASVSIDEIRDVSRSRLIAQVDIKDEITQLVNYTFDAQLGGNIPEEMVNGADEGIQHSFRITNDLFADGDPRLVNHKTYYYIVIAYAFNEFKRYDPNDPAALDGQRVPYLASRTTGSGSGISSFAAIPHNPTPENGGTKTNIQFGDMPQITRVEGTGNGGNILDLTAASEESIVNNNFEDFPVYQEGAGPITVQVIDPLSVRPGKYRLHFRDTATPGDLEDAYWVLYLPLGVDSVVSDRSIAVESEQLILDYGISISIVQAANPGGEPEVNNGALTSSIEYGDGSSVGWLSGFNDRDGQSDLNWIRSGEGNFDIIVGNDNIDNPFSDYDVGNFIDPEQHFEGILGGTWSPYRLVSFPGDTLPIDGPGFSASNGRSVRDSDLDDLPSIDIVFTNDKSKWSRSMVLEARNDVVLAQGGASHLALRQSPSVDQDGNDDGSGTIGLGWFPGYAINLETGERLNIAFAEDSWLAGENGRDMLWNPTSTIFSGANAELRIGGKHYVYVFRSGLVANIVDPLPFYDESAVLYEIMVAGNTPIQLINQASAFSSCVWAGIPTLTPGRELLETTARVKLRVSREYDQQVTASQVNGGLPLYEFDLSGFAVEFGNQETLDSALALINVVPNPYFGFSEYEVDQLDNRVKITNLPQECSISIYNVSGTLMRRFEKGDPSTSLDWDIQNSAGIPVASGVYLIHIDVPNVGERVLKWFGVIKPTDLNGF